ncbi:MAG: family 2 glycosyl transferase [Candidatus Aramenus sulfurataquae]|uniref:Dolichyl-phosphate mannose synthase n=1 Tax=Candidatus Aramenus sulfurataquae TaxID=1326980 RepID=W7KWQ1_9CREN|nr:MAG: family 2 glycosyl transferase [Candidatus Aramenus sulfurataquae]
MISVVIPAYNEEKRIDKTLTSLKEMLPHSEIIVVFDGKDNTPYVARKYGVKVLEYGNRLGKGRALKEGIMSSSMEKILLIDADMPVKGEDLKRLLLTDADLVLPRRKIVGMSKKRRLLHNGFILLTKLLFPSLRDISDFQSGVKLLNREKAISVLDELIINDFVFDVNLIYAFKRRGYKIKEVEISYIVDESDSKISRSLIKVIILMFLSLVKLRVYYSPLKRVLYTRWFLKTQDFLLRKLR